MKKNSHQVYSVAKLVVCVVATVVICFGAGAQEVVSVDPPANSHSASLNPEVVANLDDVPGVPDSSNFVIHGGDQGRMSGTYNQYFSAIGFDPDGSFFPGERIQAIVTAGMTSGGVAVTPFIWEFRTAVDSGHGYFIEGDLGSDENYSRAVAIGDVDNDGDLDVLVSDTQTQLYLNNGSGEFTNSGQNLGFAPASIALGDLDNDGDLDLVGCPQNSDAWVFLNSNGIFTDTGQSFGSSGHNDVELGDVDGDGDLDIFLSCSYTSSLLFYNDGTGTFTQSGSVFGNNYTVQTAFGDLDGDGDLDAFLAESSANSVLINPGNGNFTVGQTFPGQTDNGVELGDVDGDGDLDAVVCSWQGIATKVWLNDGSATFTDSGQALGGSNSQDVKLADFDGDGDLDILVCNHGANTMWLNDGTGIFTSNGQSMSGGTSSHSELGDLDGDGDIDAVVVNNTSDWPNILWLNDIAPPTPTPTVTPTPTPTPPCFHTGDVNQNGSITADDAQLAFLIVLSMYSPTWDENCAADCNGDGSVTASDAQEIFFTILGTGSCADPILI